MKDLSEEGQSTTSATSTSEERSATGETSASEANKGRGKGKVWWAIAGLALLGAIGIPVGYGIAALTATAISFPPVAIGIAVGLAVVAIGIAVWQRRVDHRTKREEHPSGGYISTKPVGLTVGLTADALQRHDSQYGDVGVSEPQAQAGHTGAQAPGQAEQGSDTGSDAGSGEYHDAESQEYHDAGSGAGSDAGSGAGSDAGSDASRSSHR